MVEEPLDKFTSQQLQKLCHLYNQDVSQHKAPSKSRYIERRKKGGRALLGTQAAAHTEQGMPLPLTREFPHSIIIIINNHGRIDKGDYYGQNQVDQIKLDQITSSFLNMQQILSCTLKIKGRVKLDVIVC